MRAAADRASRLDRTLLALADPTRRKLIERLGRRPTRVTDLSLGLPMSRPAVAKHLRVLKKAGLLTSVPRGREVFYLRAESPRAIEEARAYFERISGDWDRALEAFKLFAEAQGDG